MNKKIFFVIVLSVTQLFITSCVDVQKSEMQIKGKIEEANYCDNADDCKIEHFGCPFGCYSLVNKNADMAGIKRLVEGYQKQAIECLYKCGSDPKEIVCENDKCIAKETFPIGGEKDEHGCLGPAGYTWNGELGACVREWEIRDYHKDVIKTAVEHVGYTEGLTVLRVDEAKLFGAYVVRLKKGDEEIRVNIQDGKVVDKFSSERECMADSDCVTGGCSGTICQSKDAEPIITTCEWTQEYTCYKETTCSCIEGKCQWLETPEFNSCIEEARASSPRVIRI